MKTKLTIDCLINFIKFANKCHINFKNILFGRKRPDLLHISKFYKRLPYLLHKNYIATKCQFNMKDIIFGCKRTDFLHKN